jgi:hypothetical protein
MLPTCISVLYLDEIGYEKECEHLRNEGNAGWRRVGRDGRGVGDAAKGDGCAASMEAERIQHPACRSTSHICRAGH